MNIDRLDESNFLLYAAKHYDNPQCFDTIEFYEDLKRFKYIKRLFNRYIEEGDLKERLILNHIVVLFNLFGAEPAIRMLFFKCKGQESLLAPFLIVLNNLPEKVNNIGIENKTVITSDITLNREVIAALRKI
jgi:hypothetical protein